jgi:hypothetical protein
LYIVPYEFDTMISRASPAAASQAVKTKIIMRNISSISNIIEEI